MPDRDHAPLPGWDDRLCFFFDVDGTLVEIAERPDLVRLSDRTRGALARLAEASNGALALISGRSLADLDALFAPLVLPASGAHGAEHRGTDGVVHRDGTVVSVMAKAAARIGPFVRRNPGLLLEEKGTAVALHYRMAPHLENRCRALMGEIAAELGPEYHIQAGKMVLEIKSRRYDKGTAIAQFMDEAPFRGRRPVFVGDDVTDEDGFVYVNRVNGYSIRVGDSQPTVARWRLGTVSGLLSWLEALPDINHLGKAGTEQCQ